MFTLIYLSKSSNKGGNSNFLPNVEPICLPWLNVNPSRY